MEERNGKRYGGNIVEIACEKHRWRRAAGRDGRCGWGRGWEVEGARWRKNSLRKAAVEKRYGQRYEGKIVEIACEKHRWRRETGSAMKENSWK